MQLNTTSLKCNTKKENCYHLKWQMPSFTCIWIKSLSTDFCRNLCQLTFFICSSSIQPHFLSLSSAISMWRFLWKKPLLSLVWLSSCFYSLSHFSLSPSLSFQHSISLRCWTLPVLGAYGDLPLLISAAESSCGQDQRKHDCRHSPVPDFRAWFTVPLLPSSTFQLPKGMWTLIICSQLQSPFKSLKVDATSLPAEADLGKVFSERLPRQPKWKRVIWARHKILERDYPSRRAGIAYPSQKIYFWRL